MQAVPKFKVKNNLDFQWLGKNRLIGSSTSSNRQNNATYCIYQKAPKIRGNRNDLRLSSVSALRVHWRHATGSRWRGHAFDNVHGESAVFKIPISKYVLFYLLTIESVDTRSLLTQKRRQRRFWIRRLSASDRTQVSCELYWTLIREDRLLLSRGRSTFPVQIIKKFLGQNSPAQNHSALRSPSSAWPVKRRQFFPEHLRLSTLVLKQDFISARVAKVHSTESMGEKRRSEEKAPQTLRRIRREVIQCECERVSGEWNDESTRRVSYKKKEKSSRAKQTRRRRSVCSQQLPWRGAEKRSCWASEASANETGRITSRQKRRNEHKTLQN